MPEAIVAGGVTSTQCSAPAYSTTIYDGGKRNITFSAESDDQRKADTVFGTFAGENNLLQSTNNRKAWKFVFFKTEAL